MKTAKNELSAYAIGVIRYKSRVLARHHGFTTSDIPDIRQELTLYLLEHLPRHDPEKGADTTFICMLIDGKIAKMIRHRHQDARNPVREECSLNEVVQDDTGRDVLRANTITEDEADQRLAMRRRTAEEEVDLVHDVAAAVAALPDDLRRVATLLRTHRPASAARILGIPRTTLYRAIERIRADFRRKGLKEYS